MALTIAHAAAGYLVYEAARPAGPHRSGLLLGAVLLANLADADFLPGILLGAPDQFHRGFTHTLAAVALVTAVAVLAGRIGRRAWPAVGRLAAFVAAAYGSHLLLDYVTADVKPPSGARFLWPFSDAYYLAPRPLLGELVIDPSGRMAFIRSLCTETALVRWGTDLALLAAAVVLVHALRAGHAAFAAAAAVGEES